MISWYLTATYSQQLELEDRLTSGMEAPVQKIIPPTEEGYYGEYGVAGQGYWSVGRIGLQWGCNEDDGKEYYNSESELGWKTRGEEGVGRSLEAYRVRHSK